MVADRPREFARRRSALAAASVDSRPVADCSPPQRDGRPRYRAARPSANPRGTAPGSGFEDAATNRLVILCRAYRRRCADCWSRKCCRASWPGSSGQHGGHGHAPRSCWVSPTLRTTARCTESALAERAWAGGGGAVPLTLAIPAVGDRAWTCASRPGRWSPRRPEQRLREARRLREVLGAHAYARASRSPPPSSWMPLRRRGTWPSRVCTGGLLGAAPHRGAGRFGRVRLGRRRRLRPTGSKTELLGVPEAVLAQHGAVSEETVRASWSSARSARSS